VYNINKGHNTAFFERSKTLGGYSTFVDKIREYEQTLPREEAMKAAIQYCMDNNVLKPFFETHSSAAWSLCQKYYIYWAYTMLHCSSTCSPVRRQFLGGYSI